MKNTDPKQHTLCFKESNSWSRSPWCVLFCFCSFMWMYVVHQLQVYNHLKPTDFLDRAHSTRYAKYDQSVSYVNSSLPLSYIYIYIYIYSRAFSFSNDITVFSNEREGNTFNSTHQYMQWFFRHNWKGMMKIIVWLVANVWPNTDVHSSPSTETSHREGKFTLHYASETISIPFWYFGDFLIHLILCHQAICTVRLRNYTTTSTDITYQCDNKQFEWVFVCL